MCMYCLDIVRDMPPSWAPATARGLINPITKYAFDEEMRTPSAQHKVQPLVSPTSTLEPLEVK